MTRDMSILLQLINQVKWPVTIGCCIAQLISFKSGLIQEEDIIGSFLRSLSLIMAVIILNGFLSIIVINRIKHSKSVNPRTVSMS